MPGTYFPRTEFELVGWSEYLVQRLGADPQYGVGPALLADLADKQVAFAAAYAVVATPSTRTTGATLTKNQTRDTLKDVVRQAVLVVRGQRDLDGASLIDIGLSVPRARRRHISAPTDWPEVTVTDVRGNKVTLLLSRRTEEGSALGRPRDVAGAQVYALAGEVASDAAVGPSGPWKFLGQATRTRPTFPLGRDMPPGTKVWLTARWYNPRGETGPVAPPVSTHIQFGGAMQWAA